jgi:methyl-accepting chemotaxis protein
LDQIIQQNAANSEEMAATADELASQAEQLQQTMAFFSVEETPISIREESDELSGSGPPQVVRAITAHDKSDDDVIGILTHDDRGDTLDDEFERY